MLTLLEIVQRTTEFFAKREIESPRLNAEWIVAHALGLKRMDLYLQFERVLEDAQLEAIRPLVRRRAQREPLAYVLGTAPFGDLALRVDQRVLIPRPETEQLLELIQATTHAAPPARILDLGTGSGALALALAKLFPAASVLGVDASADALALARENATSHGLAERVKFARSDWFAAFAPDERFDLIVANPPYLTEAEWTAAAPEVRDHEPRAALVGADPDGAGDLLRIIADAPAHLAPGGRLFLETGIEQHPRLLDACASAGLSAATPHADYASRPRFVSAQASTG